MKTKNLLLLAMGGLLALVACGSSRADTNVDQFLPSDDPSSTVVVEFWHCLGQAKEGNLTKIIEKFNQKWAGKYEVKGVKIAGEYNALHETTMKKITSGQVPGLVMGYPDSFSEYISKNIKKSHILRLDNFINDATYGYSQTELNDFVDGYYKEGNGYQFSGTWSMPMYKSTEVMYYNANFLAGDNALNDKYFADKEEDDYWTYRNEVDGLSGEDDPAGFALKLQALKNYLIQYKEDHPTYGGYYYDVPVSWNDMVTLGRKMLADWKGANMTGEFYPFGYDSDANLMISQMAQRGIDYTVNDEESQADPEKHFKFNNSGTKALLSEIAGYLNEKWLITKNSLGGQTYTNTYFTSGKTVFSIGSTGGSDYQVSPNFSVKLGAVPYSNSTQKYIQQGPSICFFDNLNGYIHKGAWLFYKELAEPDNNAALALENSYDPVRKSSYTTDRYLNWIAKDGKGLKYSIPAMTATLQNYYMTSPVFVGSGTARTEMGNLISYVNQSGYSVEEAVDLAYSTCILAA